MIQGTCYLSRVQWGGHLGHGRSHLHRDKTKLQIPASGCWQDMAHTCHRMLLLWRSQPDILETQRDICMSSWTGRLVTLGNIPSDTAQPVSPDHSGLKDQSRWCLDSAGVNGRVIMSRLKVRFGQVPVIQKQRQGCAQCLLSLLKLFSSWDSAHMGPTLKQKRRLPA